MKHRRVRRNSLALGASPSAKGKRHCRSNGEVREMVVQRTEVTSGCGFQDGFLGKADEGVSLAVFLQ